MYASIARRTTTEETFSAEIVPDGRIEYVTHVHSGTGFYFALSLTEARRLSSALTDAIEQHDATRELDLSIARHEARQRIGAGE